MALLVVAVLVASTLVQYLRVRRFARSYPPLGEFATVDGLRLHYQKAGSGPVVLLLHGCPGFLGDYQITTPGKRSVFEDLARDHTVVALDRPGHGWSERYADRPTGLLVQADLVAGFLDTLGVNDAMIVGHSYGGALALALAVHHPHKVRAVVFVAGVSYPEGLDVEFLRRLPAMPVAGAVFRWSLAPLLMDAMVKQGLAEAFGSAQPPPGYVKTFKAYIGRPGPLQQMAYELATMQESVATLVPSYPSLNVPLSILVGDEDHPALLAGAKRLAAAVPGARLVVITGLAHEIPHLRPERVSGAVRRLDHLVATGR